MSYPFEACQKVTYSTGRPWLETDEFGVTIVIAKDKPGSKELCATAPSDAVARDGLNELVQGFCSGRKACEPSGDVEVSEQIPWLVRIRTFFGELFAAHDTVMNEHQRVTGKSLYHGPKI